MNFEKWVSKSECETCILESVVCEVNSEKWILKSEIC